VLIILALALPGLARASAPRAPAPSPPGRALVLEPFATQLGYGPSAGADVASALAAAGFSVDVMRDDQVTVPVMQSMSQYSVVYLETHSQTVDNHGFILTGDQDSTDYTAMRRDCAASNPSYCALMQGFAGHDASHLYNAITDRFIQDDLAGTFPNSTIVFINGCNLLAAPSFWNALAAKNTATLVSWDDDVDSAVTAPSAALFFKDMAQGMSVADAVAAVTAAGLGTSSFTDPSDGHTYVAHLGFLGDGTATLARAKAGDPPAATATPTSTPTVTPKPTATHKKKATPKPTATPVKKTLRCKKGYHLSHGKCVKTKKKSVRHKKKKKK
jgi:hypothetical protein